MSTVNVITRYFILINLLSPSNLSNRRRAPQRKPGMRTLSRRMYSIISKIVAPKTKVLFATARVRVYSPYKYFVTVRALLDQRFISTFIIESLTQRLVRINCSVCLTGISEMQSVVHQAVQITISPAYRDGPAHSTTALILRSFTKYLRNRVNTVYNWKHIAGLKLADSNPMKSDPIDIIIDADLFGILILNDVRQGSENEPTAQNTTLGWILSGPITVVSEWVKPKLLRITAYFYRFLNQVWFAKTVLSHAAILHSQEIQKAKRYWLKTIQLNMFPNEISNTACLLPKNSPLRAFNPYFDEDGLIRIRRLRRTYFLEATNPTIVRVHPLLVHIIHHNII